MPLFKSLCIAFSLYSGLPVPQFAWKEEEMKYALIFFPWVGAVIGSCLFLWRMLCRQLKIGGLCYVLMGAAIPLLITGGFHVDGFMDTMDAFHSWQPREKKLEILKDSHIGAFSVIMLGVYGLIYLGAFSEIQREDCFLVICGGFVLARALSGIAVVSLPTARQEGILWQFARCAKKGKVKAALYLQMLLCIAFMLYCSLTAAGAAVAAAAGSFVYYRRRCMKELGGITGDTAGYFVLLAEEAMLVAVAMVDILC